MWSTKSWVLLLSAVLISSAAGAFFVSKSGTGGRVATVYLNGELIRSIDLLTVEDSYSFEVAGAVHNTVLVERGRICVSYATCPDQTCVRQGWIEGGPAPLVCLPNRLVIQVERPAENGLDAVAG